MTDMQTGQSTLQFTRMGSTNEWKKLCTQSETVLYKTGKKQAQPSHYSWPNIYHDFYNYFLNVSWGV